MFAIVVNEKGGEQKRLEFDKPEVTIGRVQGNDIILPKGNVSKRHSRIVLKDGKFIIVDLKSTNGTYVNGRKITSPLVVKGSDKIYIGDFILSIEELQGAAVAEEPMMPPPPPRKTTASIPPPPPRRAPAPPLEEEPAASSDSPEEGEEEAEPMRPARPAQPAPAPAPLPPRPIAAMPPRPAPVPEALRPSPLPRPEPRMDPRPEPAVRQPARPTIPSAAPSMPAPLRDRRPSVLPQAQPRLALAADDPKRGRVSEIMRELGERVVTSLDLDLHRPADEATVARAERSATDLVNDLELPAGVDGGALAHEVVGELFGLGALEELLADEAVREIVVARYDRVFVDRGGPATAVGRSFSSPDGLARVLERLVTRSGRGADLAAARNGTGALSLRLDGGWVLDAALPPLGAHGPSLTLRRARRAAARLADLVGQGLLGPAAAEALEGAVRQRRNIVVSGPGKSGRTTLAAALARTVDGERVVSVEEGEELDLGEGPWTALTGRGAGARAALQHALRLGADRLVIGDVRGAEAYDLLSALVGGTEGVIAVVQAGSPQGALARLESLARLAPESPARALADDLSHSVHLVVQLARGAEGEAHVVDILDVAAGAPLGVR